MRYNLFAKTFKLFLKIVIVKPGVIVYMRQFFFRKLRFDSNAMEEKNLFTV